MASVNVFRARYSLSLLQDIQVLLLLCRSSVDLLCHLFGLFSNFYFLVVNLRFDDGLLLTGLWYLLRNLTSPIYALTCQVILRVITLINEWLLHQSDYVSLTGCQGLCDRIQLLAISLCWYFVDPEYTRLGSDGIMSQHDGTCYFLAFIEHRLDIDRVLIYCFNQLGLSWLASLWIERWLSCLLGSSIRFTSNKMIIVVISAEFLLFDVAIWVECTLGRSNAPLFLTAVWSLLLWLWWFSDGHSSCLIGILSELVANTTDEIMRNMTWEVQSIRSLWLESLNCFVEVKLLDRLNLLILYLLLHVDLAAYHGKICIGEGVLTVTS